MSLITRYRPENFKEVVGNEDVVRSFTRALEQGTNHAFLFAGPAGCGKTTMARLGASAIGCQPSDINEVDGARCTGVDAVREITSSLQYKPLNGGKKVVIIDECHRLSSNALDALLKPSEEPPEHVYWFFCTTELNKVPVTLSSRCALYKLKPLSVDQLLELLGAVVFLEDVDVPDPVLELCAYRAEGLPRQAISNLSVCLAAKTRAEAAVLLEAVEEDAEVVELARCLLRAVEGHADWVQVVKIIDKLKERSSPDAIRQVVRAYVTKVLMNETNSSRVCLLLKILENFVEPFNGPDASALLVLACGRTLFC